MVETIQGTAKTITAYFNLEKAILADLAIFSLSEEITAFDISTIIKTIKDIGIPILKIFKISLINNSIFKNHDGPQSISSSNINI